jgi:hypothetical protein
VRHVGFKDVGVPMARMRRVVARIREAGATSYLEVVSTTPEYVFASLRGRAARARVRGARGTDPDRTKPTRVDPALAFDNGPETS